jgi:hypothetical protein
MLSIRTHYTVIIIPYTSIVVIVLSLERDVVILLPASHRLRSVVTGVVTVSCNRI